MNKRTEATACCTLLAIVWHCDFRAASANVPKPFARAKLEALSGSKVSGHIEFSRNKSHLVLRVRASNLPAGKRGIHVHEHASCSGDGSGAGGHFNPNDQPHGGPKSTQRHIGDFGNLEVPQHEGEAQIELRIPHPKAGAGAWDKIVQRSVVIHGGRDDLRTDPDGDAGPRIACGVIRPR